MMDMCEPFQEKENWGVHIVNPKWEVVPPKTFVI